MLDQMNSIVLDCGFWQMKIGFSGDESPRYIERSLIGYSKNKAITSSGENWEILIGEKIIEKNNFLDVCDCFDVNGNFYHNWMEILINEMYYDKMCLDSTAFPVLFTVSPFFTEKLRSELAANFFETFKVPSLYHMVSNTGGILAEGKSSGLILDSGYAGSYTMSIFEGLPVEDQLMSS